MIDFVTRFAPPAVKNNGLFQDKYAIEKNEIEKLHSNLKTLFNNTAIKSANLSGITMFEAILNIKGDNQLSLESRRQNVLDKLMWRPPFTRQRFQSILETIWGEGNFIFEIKFDEFEVVIAVYTTDPAYYLKLENLVRDVVPANMYLVVSIQYTHIYLSQFYTYGELEDVFTYGELSQYAMESGGGRLKINRRE